MDGWINKMWFIHTVKYFLMYFKKRYYLFIFREGKGGRKRGRETSMCGWLPLACPALGTWPTTQACALTGNRTSDLLGCRPVLNPWSHTSQGHTVKYYSALASYKVLIHATTWMKLGGIMLSEINQFVT